MGDIGTHAFHLASYITGLEVEELCAELHTYVDNRLLDDDGTVMIRYKGGARCLLSAQRTCARPSLHIPQCGFRLHWSASGIFPE